MILVETSGRFLILSLKKSFNFDDITPSINFIVRVVMEKSIIHSHVQGIDVCILSSVEVSIKLS